MLPITRNYLTSRRTRPALRNRKWYTLRRLKGVVIHWTANESVGADALANRNYFNTTDRYASAHYLVDDGSIVQVLPDHEVGYHVGGRYYKPIGESIREDGLTPNYFLIGIEMCVNKDGNWNKTYQNSVELAAHLLNKYNFTVNDLYRHYDITGKLCPMMMIDEAPWQAFKNAVNNGVKFSLENPTKSGFVNTRDLNVRRGNGVQYRIVDVLHQDDPVQVYETLGNWYRIGDNRWIHKNYVQITFTTKKGFVNDPTGLNVRSGPGTNNPILDTLADGTEVEIIGKEGNWYQIGRNQYVYGAYINLDEVKTGRVIAPYFLNVRSGPGTNHPRVKQIQAQTLVKVYEEKGWWMRIGTNEWVFGPYIRI
ncbi:MAG: SH3 domain-containing protein, partial [Bacteroidota bacterium]